MRRILFLLCVMAVAFQSQASRPSYRTSESLAHFNWGIEAGGGIDMTSHDMSTVDINAYFGYRNSWINVLGFGASINMMVDNSSRAFPVYFMFQSSFRQQPSLAFFDFRTGVSFNNTQYDKQQTDFYISPGVGFNLARGKSFRSYLMLSYVYNGFKSYQRDDRLENINGLSMACLRIGINF